MTDINKEVISVLNDLIETSRDGEKGFATCAEDVKDANLQQIFTKHSQECAQAVTELQSHVRKLGGDPEDSTSFSADLHRFWSDIKSTVTGKSNEAILNEAERGEDHAKASYKKALKKLDDLKAKGAPSTVSSTESVTGSPVVLTEIYQVVERQFHGVERNHDQVKALRDTARAS